MIGIVLGLISLCVFCLIAGWIINGFNQIIDFCRERAKKYDKNKNVDGADVFLSQSSRKKNEQHPEFRKIRSRYIASYLIAKLLMSGLALVVRVSEMDDPLEKRTDWDKIKNLD